MNKTDLLLHGWDHCLDREDWYPPLRDVLKDLTEEEASWRPEGAAANTIRENLEHLLFYKERLLKRLTGEETKNPEGVTNDDTFEPRGTEGGSWQTTFAKLQAVHASIRQELAVLSDEEWENRTPDKELDLWVKALTNHDAYHTGQIVLLRKLRGSWPARRSFE
ncbi:MULTISPECIES: DinB family protein [Paenibacillus]|uniref:DinB family protein n=1 Tax=Paenibacillus TaxID=44249 RepID=UPI0022B8DC1E|nr:DinB family protein [Paenibacillus caseinilyticus]MCZ8523822.1 DinB family protein [Paenibacillus caseinilyticus]